MKKTIHQYSTFILFLIILGVSNLSTASAATKVQLNTPTDITPNSFHISWSKTGDLLFTRYEIYLKEDGGIYDLVGSLTNPDDTSCSISELIPNTKYFVFVKDVDLISSADSESIAVTTLSLPTFDPMDYDFNITKYIDGGSAIDFSWEDPISNIDFTNLGLCNIIPEISFSFKIEHPDLELVCAYNDPTGQAQIDAAFAPTSAKLSISSKADVNIELNGGILDAVDNAFEIAGIDPFTYIFEALDYDFEFNQDLSIGENIIALPAISIELPAVLDYMVDFGGSLIGLRGDLILYVSAGFRINIEMMDVELSLGGDAVTNDNTLCTGKYFPTSSPLEFEINLEDDVAGKSINIDLVDGKYCFSYESFGIYLGLGFDLYLDYGMGEFHYEKAAWLDASDILYSTYICDATSFPFEINNSPDEDLSQFEIDFGDIFGNYQNNEISNFDINFVYQFDSANIAGFSNIYLVVPVCILFTFLHKRKRMYLKRE